jgi:hypothetical protein
MVVVLERFVQCRLILGEVYVVTPFAPPTRFYHVFVVTNQTKVRLVDEWVFNNNTFHLKSFAFELHGFLNDSSLLTWLKEPAILTARNKQLIG